MATLNTKERARYAEAEEHIRKHLGGDSMVCLWEVARPASAPRIAMLAGFMVTQAPAGLLILQVFKDGVGWEVFAAPTSNGIMRSAVAIKDLWSSAPKTSAAISAGHGALCTCEAHAPAVGYKIDPMDFLYELDRERYTGVDGFEVSPCLSVGYDDGTGRRAIEVCQPWEAEIWTVYAHWNGRGAEALLDLATRSQAMACARILVERVGLTEAAILTR